MAAGFYILLCYILLVTTNAAKPKKMKKSPDSQHFCEQHSNELVKLELDQSKNISTTLSSDKGGRYSKNLFCSWTIMAPRGHRVQVKVIQYDIGTMPAGDDCYDHTYAAYKQVDIMDSFDWMNADPGIYYRMCGENRNPYEFTSLGDSLKIEFSSTVNEGNHMGIMFEATSFPEVICPPGWREDNRNESLCFKLFDHTTSWETAQEICTIQQGNLVSMRDMQELELVKELLQESTYKSFMIGLHDIGHMTMYKWIDGASDALVGTDINWIGNVTEVMGKHCSALTKDGLLEHIDCMMDKLPFICKAEKEGKSTLYKLPNMGKMPPPLPPKLVEGEAPMMSDSSAPEVPESVTITPSSDAYILRSSLIMTLVYVLTGKIAYSL